MEEDSVIYPETDTPKPDSQYEALQAEYDRVDEFRKSRDFCYKLFDGMESELKRQTITDLVNFVKNAYWRFDEDEEMRYCTELEQGVTNPKEPTPREPDQLIRKDIKETLDWLLVTDDNIARDAFWFFCLYAINSFQYWMLFGDPQKNIPPPPCNNIEAFKIFISRDLAKASEQLINGFTPKPETKLNLSMHHKVSEYTRTLRTAYFETVGVPDTIPQEYYEEIGRQ